MDVKWERITGIIALIVSLFDFAVAATGGPVAQNVFSGIFAAAAGYTILLLVSKLRGR